MGSGGGASVWTAIGKAGAMFLGFVGQNFPKQIFSCGVRNYASRDRLPIYVRMSDWPTGTLGHGGSAKSPNATLPEPCLTQPPAELQSRLQCGSCEVLQSFSNA